MENVLFLFLNHFMFLLIYIVSSAYICLFTNSLPKTLIYFDI